MKDQVMGGGSYAGRLYGGGGGENLEVVYQKRVNRGGTTLSKGRILDPAYSGRRRLPWRGRGK